MSENLSEQTNKETQDPSSAVDGESNPFKPMPAASANASAQPRTVQTSTLMIAAAVVAAALSAAFRIIIYGSDWTASLFDVGIGLTLAIAFSSVPLPKARNWRRKYWLALRSLLYFVALMAIIFTTLSAYGMLMAYAFYITAPLLISYVIERTLRLRKEDS